MDFDINTLMAQYDGKKGKAETGNAIGGLPSGSDSVLKTVVQCVEANAKLSLNNETMIRKLMGITHTGINTKGDAHEVRAMMAANAAYEAATKDNKNHGKGTSDMAEYRAFILSLAQNHVEPQSRAALREHAASLRTSADYRDVCTSCHAKECFDSAKGAVIQVVFGTRADQIKLIVYAHYDHGAVEAKVCDQRAGRSAAARKTSAALNELKKVCGNR